jgi:hypothetical protein
LIATVTYTVIGSEPVQSGIRVIQFYPASGLKIIDVIINGVSQKLSTLAISEEYGSVGKNGLVKGDWVSVTYKTIPRTGAVLENDYGLQDGVGNLVEDGNANTILTR